MSFFISNFKSILEEFNLYYLDSKYFVLFIIAIIFNIFLLKKTNNKVNKEVLIFLPLIIMLIIFNPIVFKLLDPFVGGGEGNTYWRMFWILPIAPILSYTFTKIITFKESNFYFTITGIFILILVFISGKFVYTRENYMISNNWYKMPTDAFEVIQMIEQQDLDYKKVYAPSNMVEWVRQYDGNIDLVYGRNPALVVYMGREIDGGRLKDNMDRIFNYEKCNFIVTLRDIEYDVNLEEYGFKHIGETNMYEVYMLK